MKYIVTHRAIASTLRSEIVRVDILKKVADDAEETTPAEVMLCGDNPVVITWESDDIFKPLKMSGATVKTLMENPDLSLFTGGLNDVICKIYRIPLLEETKNTILGTYGDNPTNEEIMTIIPDADWKDPIWYGFLTPNVYSQNYDDVYDELDLEFVDILSNMENVNFSKTKDGFWKSFETYITDAVSAIDEAGVLTGDIQTICETMDTDITKVGCMERNFIDETDDDADGAMTYQEVVESIMMYLNRSICYYGKGLYIYDPVTATDDIISFPTIGIAENNAQISLGDVYNKVTVVENTNPEDELTTEDIVDEDNMQSFMDTSDKNYSTSLKCYQDTLTTDEKTYISIYGEYVPKNYWTVRNETQQYSEITEVTSLKSTLQNGWPIDSATNKVVARCGFAMFSTYYERGGEPSSLDFTKEFVLGGEYLSKPMLTYKSSDQFGIKGGYLVLGLTFEYSTGAWTTAERKVGNHSNKSVEEFLNTYTSLTLKDKWKFKLRIGSLYYNGSGWQPAECTFDARHTWTNDDKLYFNSVSLDNTATYDKKLRGDKEGYAIAVDKDLFGDLELTVYGSDYQDANATIFIIISNLSLDYETVDGETESLILDDSDSDEDITYTGEIDAGNITELDDIEFKVNSWTDRATSYSYAITYDKDSKTYSFYVPTEFTEPKPLPEQTCITRYVTYYSEPRLVYSNTLKDEAYYDEAKHIIDNHLMPWTQILNTPFGSNMVFQIDGITLNLLDNSADVTLKYITTTD